MTKKQKTASTPNLSVPAEVNAVSQTAQPQKANTSADHSGKSGKLEFMHSRLFTNWMAEQKVSLAFTTYHANRVFFLGLNPKGEISMSAQTFPRVMGLWASADAQTLYLSHMYQILRFESMQDPEYMKKGVDRMYVPRHGITTGDSDIHDIAANKNGLPIFVNTLYSCLATTSAKYSFEPIWKPKFISKLAPEDRCHLNGLAMVDNNPKYVTCVSKSDVSDGWRDRRADGGLVIDVTTDDEVAGGLAMPHSPRWHNGKLWVHNSGRGEFGYVDLKAGKFEPVTFCPGYLRGMAFIGDYAIVGMSLSRHNINFDGLPLDQALKDHNAEARCGIQVIDLNTGNIVHGIRLGGAITELYDVVVLPNTRNPVALNFNKTDLPKLLNPPPMRVAK